MAGRICGHRHQLCCGAVCHGVYVAAVRCLQNTVCSCPHQHTLHDRAHVPANKPRQRSFQQAPLPAPGKGNGYACGVLNVCSVQLRQACHNSSLHDSNCSMCCDYRCASHSAQKILQASGGMMLADLRRNAKNRRTGCNSRPPVFAYGSQSAFSSSTRSISLRPLNVHGATLISLYPSEWYSRRARVLRTFVSIRRYRQPCRLASCS